ncbi:hypothetical protein F4680DRAFT_452980 [Xylaria scruposa]|nr:hypothetical protein F4680DRAFT_452980 [Xylaria scruposa]
MYGDINMNVIGDDNQNPCVDPTAIMQYTMGTSNIIGDPASMNDTPYIYEDVLMYDTTEQTSTIVDNTQFHFQPIPDVGTSYYSGPPISPTVIQYKLHFLLAVRKNVQTGKEFVAVARITNGKKENPFVNAQGTAYHYIPTVKHQQFNTSSPLSQKELAEATCEDRVFAVHKTIGTSCAPAGTYMIYRLKCSESGTRNLRFEAIWDWGNGFVGRASYDFISLTAHDDCVMKPYTALQMKLLNELWPEWEMHLNC